MIWKCKWNFIHSYTGRSWRSSALARPERQRFGAKKKPAPKGWLKKSCDFFIGGWLLRWTEGDNHLPIVLPVDGDDDTALLSNAERTITVLHLLCLNLVLRCCEVHSSLWPVESIAFNCGVKRENVSRKDWVLIRGLTPLHQVCLDAV